jgi:hypothetical protein
MKSSVLKTVLFAQTVAFAENAANPPRTSRMTTVTVRMALDPAAACPAAVAEESCVPAPV